MLIQSKSVTAASIVNGQTVMASETKRVYHNVTVRPCVDDDTFIVIQSNDGSATIVGASSLFWVME